MLPSTSPLLRLLLLLLTILTLTAAKSILLSTTCHCDSNSTGLFCGSRSFDETSPSLLCGICEKDYVYRCNGTAGGLARVQVYCGKCVRGVERVGVDRCME